MKSETHRETYRIKWVVYLITALFVPLSFPIYGLLWAWLIWKPLKWILPETTAETLAIYFFLVSFFGSWLLVFLSFLRSKITIAKDSLIISSTFRTLIIPWNKITYVKVESDVTLGGSHFFSWPPSYWRETLVVDYIGENKQPVRVKKNITEFTKRKEIREAIKKRCANLREKPFKLEGQQSLVAFLLLSRNFPLFISIAIVLFLAVLTFLLKFFQG